jgi:hypothetical protein
MSHTAIAAHDLPSVILPRTYTEAPPRVRIAPTQPGVWKRLSFWVAEFLRLVAVVYLLPIVILAIGIPIALAVNGLIFAAGWVLTASR